MRLSELIRSARVGTDGVTSVIGDDWLQGRSLFGGVQAVAALLAMRTRVAATLPLRTLQMTFIAPVAAGEVRARAQLLRTGKSASHVEAHLLDGEQRLAIAIGVFGEARDSRVAHRPRRPEVVAEHETRMPWIAGVTPAFTRHFDARWRRGGLPFTGSTSRQSVVDIDMIDDGAAGEAHLLALADFIPPVALSLLDAPTAGSSLTWMLEMTGAVDAAAPLQGWRIDSEMVAAQDGYTSQSTRLWAPDGQLAALSRQSMVVFG